jgi:hypothetical protein
MLRMAEPVPFPIRPDEITPDWLNRALSASLPDMDVARVEVLDQHSGTTGRVRLGLHHAAGSAGPASVFVKLPPFDESQRKLVAATDMGRREARFYAGPATEVPMRIPRSYFAAAGDERTEYVMVLEDLVASGCRFTTRLAPIAEEGGGRLIEGLARVHAHFWNDERLDSSMSWVRPAMRGAYGAELVRRAREQFADELPPVFRALCDLYIDHHERICEIWDDGERTLIHGDTHAGNQFVDDGDEIGLYDWAVLSRSPGIRDVAIFLGNSCPTDVRRENQERWIGRYRDLLVEQDVDAPPFAVLWDRYRMTVLYAWVAAATTAAMGAKWQPIEVGMAGTNLATTACADLDTIDALRAAL